MAYQYKFNVFTGTFDLVNTSGGGSSDTWYQDEVPTGTKNGSNTVFHFLHDPTKIFFLFLNGQYQVSGTDYTRSSEVVTMTTAPLSTDILVANYIGVPIVAPE